MHRYVLFVNYYIKWLLFFTTHQRWRSTVDNCIL